MQSSSYQNETKKKTKIIIENWSLKCNETMGKKNYYITAMKIHIAAGQCDRMLCVNLSVGETSYVNFQQNLSASIAHSQQLHRYRQIAHSSVYFIKIFICFSYYSNRINDYLFYVIVRWTMKLIEYDWVWRVGKKRWKEEKKQKINNFSKLIPNITIFVSYFCHCFFFLSLSFFPSHTTILHSHCTLHISLSYSDRLFNSILNNQHEWYMSLSIINRMEWSVYMQWQFAIKNWYYYYYGTVVGAIETNFFFKFNQFTESN